MLHALHHVAIICSDYQKSKHFYTQILGLTVVQETYRAERDSWKLDLAVGNHYQIELFFVSQSAGACFPPGGVRIAASGLCRNRSGQ